MELAKPLDKNVSEIISTKVYLDDLVAALNTPQEAIELVPKLNNLLKIFGLETHKWASNSQEVMESIPKDQRGTEKLSLSKRLGNCPTLPNIPKTISPTTRRGTAHP